MTSAAAQPALRWDIYCRVIDNFGDIGVCWRLCQDLSSRGHLVRLIVDDAQSLAWMRSPDAAPVEVLTWSAHEQTALPGPKPDIVVEGFGCDPPPAHIAHWRGSAVAPVWVNLEYLSAEQYVERSHGLPSPQFAGPGAGLTKWFFYPGFTARTGGLLREPTLRQRQQAFEAGAWLRQHGLEARPGRRRVSLFCYASAPLPALLAALPTWADGAPIDLLTTVGQASQLAQQCLSDSKLSSEIHLCPLPWLSQPDFDHLLWACDLNLVRGEDSAVRAQWAGRPFLWQLYPQDDGAHGPKLEAFLKHHLGTPNEESIAAPLARAMRGWNGLLADTAPWALPQAQAWESHSAHWRDQLSLQTDLCTQLVAFVLQKAAHATGGSSQA